MACAGAGEYHADPLWSFETYRKALFLSDLAWFDAEKLLHNSRGKVLVWQLLDAAGSVPANIEEGFGHGFGKDYGQLPQNHARFAPRNPCGWCYRSRHVFDPAMLDRRLKLADEIISGLVTTAKQQYNR